MPILREMSACELSWKFRSRGMLPITWRKRDAPKLRRGLPELDSNFGPAARLSLNKYHAARLFFAGNRVLQNECLIRRDFSSQADQCAVRANRQRMRAFKKVAARAWHSVNDYRNAQRKPLAPPLLGPTVWRNYLMLSHETLILYR